MLDAPSQNVMTSWERFRSHVQPAAAREVLRGAATSEELAAAEATLGFALPPGLRELLSLSNGQVPGTPGLFVSRSGASLCCRHVFLDAAGVARSYRDLLSSESCVRSLGSDEVPFAVQGSASCGFVFSVHRTSGAVSLLWTEVSDWTLPADWQIARYPWAACLATFLDDQVALYR